MDITQILEGFKHRGISWMLMKEILKMCDLSVGRGWDNTIKKIKDAFDEAEIPINTINRLKKIYDQQLLVGEKSITLFKIDRIELDKLIDCLKQENYKTTVFNSTFPFPLPNNELKKAINNACELVDVKEYEDSLVFTYCSKRLVNERTEISRSDLSTEAIKEIGDFDELFKIKKIPKQYFDMIVFWKNKNFIEIRIDLNSGLSNHERSDAYRSIKTQLLELINKQKLNLRENINFFPLIDILYRSNEGKVFELSFTTEESIKNEIIKKKQKKDLRQETYHRAGKEATEKENLYITPYHVAILWDNKNELDIKTNLEVKLPSSHQYLSISNPNLREFMLLNCVFLTDYEFIFNKMINYLENGG